LAYRLEEYSLSKDQKEGEKEAPEVESPIYKTSLVSIPSVDTVDLLGLIEAWHLMVLSRNWPVSLHPPIIILVRLIENWLGDFDKLTLDSLYEDAMVRKTAYSG